MHLLLQGLKRMGRLNCPSATARPSKRSEQMKKQPSKLMLKSEVLRRLDLQGRTSGGVTLQTITQARTCGPYCDTAYCTTSGPK
jgi:hypothetical protein